MASDLRGGFVKVARNQQRVTIETWRKQKRIEREQLEAVVLQIEIGDDRSWTNDPAR